MLSSRARTALVAYLLLLQFLYAWAWSSSDVLRPLFRRLYNLTLAEAGTAYSAQVVGALVGGLLFGRVEHFCGRRITLAMIGVGCGSILAAGVLVESWVSLVAQRAVLGVFMGAVFPVTVGLMLDLFPANSRGRFASMIDATYFLAVVALGWTAAAWVEIDWRRLFWPVGTVLVCVGLSAFLLILPHHPDDPPSQAPRARDLFGPTLRRRTIALTAMIGANACGHQAFTGWLTLYLREVDGVSHSAVAATLSAQYCGSIIGCFAWGFIVDHWGRRMGAFGFLAAGLFSALFVLLPGPFWAKQVAAFGFGFAFAAVVTLGPWLAELYPPALRGPATSIFQWGRFISLVVPPVSGAIAATLGLTVVMVMATAAFVVSALIWRSLPETHYRQ